ncbi:MAG: chorismate mutase [Clostridia bacterium]|nr:chorismate mutase [Clostridia bacterium]
MDLNEIRNEIDKIDDSILESFLKRMELCGEVAKNKIQTGKSVSDGSREDSIVYRLSTKTPNELKFYLKELYSTMFAVSKSYQSTLINKTSKSVEKIKEVLLAEDRKFPVSATVACQGVKGANSGVAAKRIFPICDISYFKNFEGVFTAVDKGFCEFGVLPIENSTAGSVLEVYDLMNKYSFFIARSVRLKINHSLAVLPGTEKKDIKKVISHSQAISQCSKYIKNHNFEAEAVENTAVAARILSESNDKSVAVLCSNECAEIYGLKILEESVQDNSNNYTRFILISKNLNVYEGSDRISVMTSAPHESGSLSKILARFSALGLSLTKIESRPISGSDFEFLFYFDFLGNVQDKGVLNLIAEMENSSMMFTFLGAYKETI